MNHLVPQLPIWTDHELWTSIHKGGKENGASKTQEVSDEADNREFLDAEFWRYTGGCYGKPNQTVKQQHTYLLGGYTMEAKINPGMPCGVETAGNTTDLSHSCALRWNISSISNNLKWEEHRLSSSQETIHCSCYFFLGLYICLKQGLSPFTMAQIPWEDVEILKPKFQNWIPQVYGGNEQIHLEAFILFYISLFPFIFN